MLVYVDSINLICTGVLYYCEIHGRDKFNVDAGGNYEVFDAVLWRKIVVPGANEIKEARSYLPF